MWLDGKLEYEFWRSTWPCGKCVAEELDSGSYPGAQAVHRRRHLVSGWMGDPESLGWVFIAGKGSRDIKE